MVLVKLRVRGTRDGHRTDIYQTTEEARHPEPRRRRRIAKLQALCILRSFVALRRLQDDGDFFTTSELRHCTMRSHRANDGPPPAPPCDPLPPPGAGGATPAARGG